MIPLHIDPYYHNAYVYFRDHIHPQDNIYLRKFHQWLKNEYNLEIVIPFERY